MKSSSRPPHYVRGLAQQVCTHAGHAMQARLDQARLDRSTATMKSTSTPATTATTATTSTIEPLAPTSTPTSTPWHHFDH